VTDGQRVVSYFGWFFTGTPAGCIPSPVAANGNIYFTLLQDGTVTVLKAGTEKPEVVATNPKLVERTAATPAIADDIMFIRTDKRLYAFQKK
jgi:outer membrane protein assembly factor BamB